MTISATAPPLPGELIRLHVIRRAAIDTEGPYLDEPATVDDGALARATRLAEPAGLAQQAAPVAALRLVHTAEVSPPARADDAPAVTAEPTFGPVRTPRFELPAPGPQAARLTRLLLEVLAGDRPARQLAACANAEVCDEVEVLVSPRSPRPWAGSLRRLVVCEPVPGIAEVTAIVVQGLRTVALALRMEGVDGRWQLTALQVA